MPGLMLDAEFAEMQTALFLELPSARSSPVPDLPSPPFTVPPLWKPRLSTVSQVWGCSSALLSPFSGTACGRFQHEWYLPWQRSTQHPAAAREVGRGQEASRLDLQTCWVLARQSSYSKPCPVCSHPLRRNKPSFSPQHFSLLLEEKL